MTDGLTWQRIQFAFSVTFHDLFPPLTMGLALLIVLFKSLVLRRGEGWVAGVNAVMAEAECTSIRRDRPLGSELWMRETAGTLGLESSLRKRGRPRRKGNGRPGDQ